MKKLYAAYPRGVPFPILTVLLLTLSALGTALQLYDPRVFLALRRDPAALGMGEWWRVISPLVVNDGNPFLHWLYVSVGIALVGVVVEQQWGHLCWLVLAVAGAFAGTFAGYLWDPYGAGGSIVLCGLVGGLALWQLRQQQLHLLSSIYAVGLVVALAVPLLAGLVTTDSIVQIIVAAAAGWLSIMLLLFSRRASVNSMPLRYVFGLVLICALILAALRDIHGVALLAGLGVAALFAPRTFSEKQKQSPPLSHSSA